MGKVELPPLVLKNLMNLAVLCIVAPNGSAALVGPPLAAIIGIFVPGRTGKLLQAFFWSLPMFGSLWILFCGLVEYHRQERERP